MNYYKEIKKLQERVERLEIIEDKNSFEKFKVQDMEQDMEKQNREKITLKEFFENENPLCIHCDTEEKANKLLKEFDEMGEEWGDGATYERNRWLLHKDKTCYSNYNTYCYLDWYKQNNTKIYEFEDVIFEEVPKFTEDEKVILRNLPEEYKWIARDENGSLYITVRQPTKDKYGWLIYNGVNMFLFKPLFKSIKWEDEEPCEFRKYI